MAKRDVQLVIKARSEADRAIDSITSAMRTLMGVQDDLSGSGERTSNTLESIARAFNTLDKAVVKIEQGVANSERTLDAQRASLAENEARYNALVREIEAAERAIVSTRIAMQTDGSAELAAKLGAAQTAYRQLTGEATRLETRLSAQRSEVATASTAYEELKGAATAAQIAMGDMGDQGEREAMRVAAASREAAEELREQARAAREAFNQKQARAAFDDQLGVRDIQPGAARSSAAVFEADAEAKRDAARATEELEAAAARLKARARPVAAAQERINGEMKEARALYAQGKISIRDLTAELDRLENELKQVDQAQKRMNSNRNGSKELKGAFGLRPYELQNLSYQINDLFTQIASGTPASQAFAQQGGQIVQLFPKLLTGILKYARALTLVGAVLTPVIIGMGRLSELAELQKDFEASLRLSADGARYNTEALVENVEVLDRFGASFEDASDAVKTFIAESVNPEMIDDFSAAAQNLATVTGVELKDAVSDVAKAFTGGYKEIAEFDDKLNFLTLSEREQIRALFDSGDASEARRIAFNAFYDDAQDGAAATEDAWDRMSHAMSNAWLDFTNFLADTKVFKDLRREIDEIAIGATYVLNRVRGLSHEAAALDAVGVKRADGPTGRDGPDGDADPLDTDSDRNRKRESDKRYNDRKKGRSGKSQADRQADLNREIARANREREIEAEQLGRTNVLQGEALILEQRRQAIADAIRAIETKAAKDGKKRLTVTQAQRDEIARTVGLEFDAKNAKALAQAEQQDHERKINDLVARRREIMESLEFATPGSEQYQRIQTAVLGVNLQLEAAREEARTFWHELAGDPERMALLGYTREQIAAIAKDLENAQNEVRRDTLEAAQARAESGLAELREMQGLLQEQIEFAQLQGEGGRAGKLQEQLTEVNLKLREGAQVAIEYWRAVRGSPEDMAVLGMTPEAVDNVILGLENTIAAAEQLRTQYLKTGKALNEDLAAGGVDALDQFAEGIIRGENVLKSFANSFLQFSADFLLQIAKMIAQQAIFNAISGGAPGGAGGAGGLLSGLIGGLFHGGGVVGGTNGRSRAVSAAIFANASRYHSGGIAGLKPDEVPAILQRGEEVLTRADERHRANGGKGGGKGVSQVLAIGEEQIAKAVAGAAGREVTITHIRENRATIRQELGID